MNVGLSVAHADVYGGITGFGILETRYYYQ
jgi:hypothetical protein